jgi:ubiquitin C-terminal hydrolase
MTLSLTFESSLDKSLQNFLQVDTLGLSNEYKCEKCRRESKAMIHTELSKMPSILTFHLKRFTFPKLKKLTGHCKYPP